MPDVRLLQRADGREASRARPLVVPAVVCANAVVAEIARRTGAAFVNHQHGCAQVGDDARGTTLALERLAAHPNAAATLVVSLGCETLQGAALVERLQARGVRAELVGIQAEGGSSATVAAGVARLGALRTPDPERRPAGSPARVGVAFMGATDELARRYAADLEDAGLDVTGPVDVTRAPVLGLVELATADPVLAVVLVADRGLPVAPVLVPVVAVAATEEHFERTEGAFDVVRPDGDALAELVAETLSGRETAGERTGETTFALRRTALSA